jgi:hypothetical protein
MAAPIRYTDKSTITIDDNAKTLLMLGAVVLAGAATYLLVSRVATAISPATLTPSPLPTSDPTPDLPVVQT